MALVENKYIGREYEILESFDAGIELLGYEVKSLKEGRGSLKGAYVIIRGGEAFLVGMHVPAYQPANTRRTFAMSRYRRVSSRSERLFAFHICNARIRRGGRGGPGN